MYKQTITELKYEYLKMERIGTADLIEPIDHLV